MRKRTREVNEHGIGMTGLTGEWLRDIRVYEEGGSVQLWVDVIIRESGSVQSVLQYLSPADAMAFSKAFERCAVAAMKATG